ncbi:MAG: hypothetical protein OXJ53_17315 [Gammaproteobacteria bacterium]|nr:hypothetical protein [Gammaproteobacteria bacterium]MDE0270858.1 hypothetical protein [Gammaproteobacteria bacterium]
MKTALLAITLALCAATPSLAREVPWESLDADLKEKYRVMGTRGERRTDTEARKVRATLPESIRTQGSDAERYALRGMDWSHKTPYSMGGSNLAANGVFESSERNRARGARQMTPVEVRDAQKAHQAKSRAYKRLTQIKGVALGGVSGLFIGAGVIIYKHHHLLMTGCLSADEARNQALIEIAAMLGVSVAAGAGLGWLLTTPLASIAGALSIGLVTAGIAVFGEELWDLLNEDARPRFVDAAPYTELDGYVAPLATSCAIGEIAIAAETANNPSHWLWVHDAAGQPFTLYRDAFRVGNEIAIGPHQAMKGWVDPPRLP